MTPYAVYILSSYSRTLYIGVTNDIQRRVAEHKQKLVPGFTNKYNVDRLVYCEFFTQVNEAIMREKQLKKWSRKKKELLIEKTNPQWEDLSEHRSVKELLLCLCEITQSVRALSFRPEFRGATLCNSAAKRSGGILSFAQDFTGKIPPLHSSPRLHIPVGMTTLLGPERIQP